MVTTLNQMDDEASSERPPVKPLPTYAVDRSILDIPEPTDGGVMICFQFVTKGGAVIDTEAEEWATMKDAMTRAEEWMNLSPSRTISFVTFEKDGAVVRPGETEHIAVMPAQKMAALYAEAIAAQEGSAKDE